MTDSWLANRLENSIKSTTYTRFNCSSCCSRDKTWTDDFDELHRLE